MFSLVSDADGGDDRGGAGHPAYGPAQVAHRELSDPCPLSAEPWASRDALEGLLTADFIALSRHDSDDRETLIAAILGEDPGTWRVEDSIVRELTPAVARC